MDAKFYFDKNRQGFTLIELLVVIAIIGLLSSIVLVSMQGAKGGAQFAKTLDFSHRLQNSLGAYAVGWWSFEKKVDDKFLDASGYENHCTAINGAGITPGLEQFGNAVALDHLGKYLDCGDSSSLNQTTKELTIEAWVSFSFSNEDNAILSKGDPTMFTWAQYLLMHTNNNIWKACFYRSDYCVDYSYTPQLNTWYHIAATFNSGKAIIYLNGEAKNSETFTADYTGSNNMSLFIGKYAGSGSFYGLIDEVRIYNKAISSAEIQKHYTEGMEKHKNLTSK